ncbi:MAG: hypothetical protein IPP03_19535, partial [Dechloromonas sp.]|nr:hypothetical protein [Candidatus Dechloromonas phosphoritropha]
MGRSDHRRWKAVDGKTAFALNIAENRRSRLRSAGGNILDGNGGTQLAGCGMLVSIGRPDSHRVRSGRPTDDEWSRSSFALGKLHEAPIYIDETGGLTPGQPCASWRDGLARQHGGKARPVLVIDYSPVDERQPPGRKPATPVSD